MYFKLPFLLGHNIVPYLYKSISVIIIIINIAAIGFGVQYIYFLPSIFYIYLVRVKYFLTSFSIKLPIILYKIFILSLPPIIL